MRAKVQRRTRVAAGLSGVRGAHGRRKREGLMDGPRLSVGEWKRKVRCRAGPGRGRRAGPAVEFWATGKKRKKRGREKEMGLLGLIQEEEKEMALHF